MFPLLQVRYHEEQRQQLLQQQQQQQQFYEQQTLANNAVSWSSQTTPTGNKQLSFLEIQQEQEKLLSRGALNRGGVPITVKGNTNKKQYVRYCIRGIINYDFNLTSWGKSKIKNQQIFFKQCKILLESWFR